MKPTHPTTVVGRHLVWLVLQMWFLVPLVLGPGTIRELPYGPAGTWLLHALLTAVIGSFVVRKLARLWLAPVHEASSATTVALMLVGTLFLLISTGPLVASEKLSTKPLGIAYLLVGVFLGFLASRDAMRVRSRPRATAAT